MAEVSTYQTLNNLALWQHMGTTTLERMRGVKLMNRIDTKYVLHYDEAIQLLETAATQGYMVQIIGQVRACRYQTLYYDTAERAMYVAHHNRKLTRQKIRTRHYVESGITFLEIKNKTNRGRTRKRRVEIAHDLYNGFYDDGIAAEFYNANANYPIGDIAPALTTEFTRITLVNKEYTERLTIDFDLRYCDMQSGREGGVAEMVILELKQDGRRTSQIKRILEQMRIRPLKVSKYCLGTVLTVKGVKDNRFKAKLRDIEKRLGNRQPTLDTTTKQYNE